jgi:hypothetical protein
MEDRRYIKISPESIDYKDFFEMDVNFVIPLTQDCKDIGFYTPFDGLIIQKDVINNFVFEVNPNNQYNIKVYNTSDEFKNFLKLSNYYIFWGDGTSQTFNEKIPNYLEHNYDNVEGSYVITLKQTNPWGDTVIQKKITLPTQDLSTTIDSAILIGPNENEYSFDSITGIENQVSSEYTNVPFIISGYTTSKLNELSQYGPTKFIPGKMVKKYNEEYGLVTEINDEYTAYTVNNIDYYDYRGGETIYFVNSSGLTENMIEDLPLTKEEVLMGVVASPEIQSAVFIDRGKQAGFESFQRLGEVDNLGDLTSYGYGYFKIKKL